MKVILFPFVLIAGILMTLAPFIVVLGSLVGIYAFTKGAYSIAAIVLVVVALAIAVLIKEH